MTSGSEANQTFCVAITAGLPGMVCLKSFRLIGVNHVDNKGMHPSEFVIKCDNKCKSFPTAF